MIVSFCRRLRSTLARCRRREGVGSVMSNKMNSKGVTLVEVMISMVILLIVFMGLIQASLLTINHNMRNEVRDEAVRVGAASMALLRSFNYSCGELDPVLSAALVNGTLSNCGYTPPLATATLNTPTRNFRNLGVQYTVTKGIVATTSNTKQFKVTVQWRYPGDDPATPAQSHTIYYTMRNPVQ